MRSSTGGPYILSAEVADFTPSVHLFPPLLFGAGTLLFGLSPEASLRLRVHGGVN